MSYACSQGPAQARAVESMHTLLAGGSRPQPAVTLPRRSQHTTVARAPLCCSAIEHRLRPGAVRTQTAPGRVCLVPRSSAQARATGAGQAMRYRATGTLRRQALLACTRKRLCLASAARARARAAAGAGTGRPGRLHATVWQAVASKCGQTAAPARRRSKAGTPPRAAAALPAAARKATLPSRHTGGPARAGRLGCGAVVRLSAG